MALAWPPKDSNEVLDYEVDWTERLSGDTISTSTFTLIKAAGLVINSQSFTDTSSKVWLRDGTTGEKAQILCRITTAGGRTMDQTIALLITDK